MKNLRVFFSAFSLTIRQYASRPVQILETILTPFVFATVCLVIFSTSQNSSLASYAVLVSGVMGMWGGILLGGGYSIDIERYLGTLEYLLVTPASLQVIVAGKAFASSCIGILNMGLVFLVAELAYGIRLDVAFPIALVISILLSITSFVALGVMLSSIFVLSRSAAALGNIFEFLIYVICGIMYPITLLPIWIQPISYALSPTWAAHSIMMSVNATSFLEGRFLLDTSMLIILSLCYLLIGKWLFKKIEYRSKVTGSLVRY